MGYEYRKTIAYEIVWRCDWNGCDVEATTPEDSRREIKYQKPTDWCGVLMTSMLDGDYSILLCPEHSFRIKQSVDREESAPCGECAQRGKHHRFCSLFAA